MVQNFMADMSLFNTFFTHFFRTDIPKTLQTVDDNATVQQFQSRTPPGLGTGAKTCSSHRQKVLHKQVKQQSYNDMITTITTALKFVLRKIMLDKTEQNYSFNYMRLITIVKTRKIFKAFYLKYLKYISYWNLISYRSFITNISNYLSLFETFLHFNKILIVNYSMFNL